METHKAETVSHRPKRDVYWWPLVIALVVTAVQHALSLARRARHQPPLARQTSEEAAA
jgi:Ca-activated chloride channel family protein